MINLIYCLVIAVVSLLSACSTTQSLHPARLTQPPVQDNRLETQLDQLSRNISASLSQQKRAKIAVIEFADLNGSVSDLGKFLAEELTTRLFASKAFEVIERRLIEKLLREQQLSMSGIVDEKTALKVGSLLGADYIATGTTADLGSGIKVNARIISVERGSVFSAASVMIPKNEQVKMLIGKNTAAETKVNSGAYDISGTWKFVCCSGKYWGETDLTLYDGNRIKGRFYDLANKSGGTIDGTINGNTVLFSRNKGEQDYKLTLSDDGKSMSGFFVGSHDGSVGTEVTFTRGNPQQSLTKPETAEGMLTSWRDGNEFGREMDNYWKDGYYPAVVEGRNLEGRSQFRAVVQPFPKRVWWFYWWYDQSQSSYEEHKRKMIADGFKEIHVQVFTDPDGVRKYQTCWIKYGP